MRDMNRILLFTKVVYLISNTWSAKLGWTLLLNTESTCIRKVLIYYKPWCAKLSVYHGQYNLHNFPQCYQKVHQLYVIPLFVFQHLLMIFFFIWFNNHSFLKNPDQSDWKSLKLIFNWSSLNCKVSSFSYAIFNSSHFNQLGYHIWVNASSVWFNCHSSLLLL